MSYRHPDFAALGLTAVRDCRFVAAPKDATLPDGFMSTTIREITTICVDQTEFLVSKLKDRGTHQAFGVVTNAQDFMRLLQLELGARI